MRLPRAHLNESATGQLRELGPGVYKVELLVGDALLDSALRVEAGTIRLALPELGDDTRTQDSIIYQRPLLHDSDRASWPLPAIQHVFHSPDARPPAWASWGVSAVVAAIALSTAWRAVVVASRAPARAGVSCGLLAVFLSALTGVAVALAAYFFEAYDVFGLVGVVGALCCVLGVAGRALMQPLA
jgi:hypothetical protein